MDDGSSKWLQNGGRGVFRGFGVIPNQLVRTSSAFLQPRSAVVPEPISWARGLRYKCTLTTCRHGPVAQNTRNRRTVHSTPPNRMAPTRLQQRHSSQYRCGCPRGQKVPTTRSQRARSAKRLLRSQRSRRASRLLQPLDHRLRRAARGKAAAALHRGQAASAASASV